MTHENAGGEKLTDAEAGARYGPNWPGVLKVISQAATLTGAQLDRAAALAAGWDAAWGGAGAASAAGRGDAVAAAWAAAHTAAGVAARGSASAGPAAWVAAWVAAAAAVVSDLVEEHGPAAKHIAILARAWDEIIGE